MWKAHGLFGALLPRPYAMATVSALAIWLELGSALAEGRYDDPNTAEGWAWPQIQQSEMADFNERCNTPALDPSDEQDARWRDDCRTLSARFLQDLLARSPWREAVPFAGIQVKGARIVGDFDLENATLVRSISILASRIEGSVNLVRARTNSLIWLEGSLINGPFDAPSLHSESDVWLLKGSVFKREVNLRSAKIDGGVKLAGARFEGKLDAGQVRIGGSLDMNSEDENKASFNEVSLIDAEVGGQINMLGASFSGPLRAHFLKVRGNLLAASAGQYKTRFQNVFLMGAEIAGSVSLIGDNFEGELFAGFMQIGGSLFMNSDGENKARFKKVFLDGARVAGNISMVGASFDSGLTAYGLQIGGDLVMRQAHYGGDVNMEFTRVGGNLDLRRATLAHLDLSGASVAGELRLGSITWASKEGRIGSLYLLNTNVRHLMDTTDAWPGELRLDGYRFGHLGGSGGQAGLKMRARGMKWWDNWVRLDPQYHPILYEQLAAAFTSLGDRNAANEIRYLGLERKRMAACEEYEWNTCLILTTQWFVTGYGIGLRVLYSVIFFSLVSATILWSTVPAAKQHGLIWCFGASLSQLLPGIQINKEFTEFFYDPERTRLKGWHIFLFSALRIIGLALGATLIIAVSGLMP